MRRDSPLVLIILLALAIGLFWSYFGPGAALLALLIVPFAWGFGRISGPPQPAEPRDDGD